MRPYKPAWTVADAVEYMRQQAGRHFDPRLVDILVHNREEIVAIGERFADQSAH